MISAPTIKNDSLQVQDVKLVVDLESVKVYEIAIGCKWATIFGYGKDELENGKEAIIVQVCDDEKCEEVCTSIEFICDVSEGWKVFAVASRYFIKICLYMEAKNK